MEKIKKIIFNGAIMTLTSLFLRWVGVIFNAYISNKLGSEGMGIYSLVQSVFGFAVTFACSGINLGTTRLVSEALAVNKLSDIKKSMKKSVLYSLFFSVSAFFILYFGANYIGTTLLGDIRTIKAIEVLAVALPFISISSVFNGYFSAVRRVYKTASVMIIENLVQIGVTMRIFSLFYLQNVEYACISVAVGTLISEIISFTYNAVLYLYDIKRYKTTDAPSSNLGAKLTRISLPLAFSAYARSGLITIEHLLIPYGLRKSGVDYSTSMSTYGLINGMVFPVIMFPSCIIYSFSGLMIPEFARLNERKERKMINDAVSKVLRYTLCFSVCVSGILICYAYEISQVFYNSSEAYGYIRLFAPLVTVMYLDGAVDGILKGLNEQLYSMKINILDASISVVLVYLLIPRYSVKGYIITVFVCEILNCCMSLTRLIKVCDISTSIFTVLFKPLICIVLSTFCVMMLFDYAGITYFNSLVNLIMRIFLTVALYGFLMFIKIKKLHKIIPSS